MSCNPRARTVNPVPRRNKSSCPVMHERPYAAITRYLSLFLRQYSRAAPVNANGIWYPGGRRLLNAGSGTSDAANEPAGRAVFWSPHAVRCAHTTRASPSPSGPRPWVRGERRGHHPPAPLTIQRSLTPTEPLVKLPKLAHVSQLSHNQSDRPVVRSHCASSEPPGPGFAGPWTKPSLSRQSGLAHGSRLTRFRHGLAVLMHQRELSRMH